MTLIVHKKIFGSNGSGSDSGSEKLKYFGSVSVLGSKKCGTAGLYPSYTYTDSVGTLKY